MLGVLQAGCTVRLASMAELYALNIETYLFDVALIIRNSIILLKGIRGVIGSKNAPVAVFVACAQVVSLCGQAVRSSSAVICEGSSRKPSLQFPIIRIFHIQRISMLLRQTFANRLVIDPSMGTQQACKG